MNVTRTIEPTMKVPPSAVELERTVLGAILLYGRALSEVSDFLVAEHFYKPEHRWIYEAMIGLRNSGVVPDLVTVFDRLKTSGNLEKVGGAIYVSGLTNGIASTAHLQGHARILVQKFLLRSLMDLGAQLTQIDETNDPFDILEEVNAAVGKVNAITSNADPDNAASLIAEMVDNREQPLQLGLGLGPVDECVTLGPGNVCVIGARPAVGKTAVALTTARSVAMQGHNVAFISLEMSAKQLMARLLSTLTGIDSNRITRNDLTDQERSRMAEAMTYHAAWIERVIIDDRATLRGHEAFGLLARMKSRHKCEVVIVDYLQLAEGEGSHPTEKMSSLSKCLKQAAKASQVRLIELSQLRRSENKPTIADLRESGQIEADGDVIILLSREKGSPVLTVDVAKHKFGPTGDFEISYDLSTQTIGASVPLPQITSRPPVRSWTETEKDETDTAPF